MLALSCTLSACGPVEPVSTPPANAQPARESPSPAESGDAPEQFSPITSEPPQTTLEALENATKLTTAYMQARSYMWQRPLESAVLKHYAHTPEVDAEVHRAREAAANGWVLSGTFQFHADLNASYVQPLTSTINETETEIPFGQVTLSGCEDASGITVLNTTQPGQSAIFKTPPRVRVNLIVGYNHIEKRWLLLARHLPDGKQAEC